MRKIKAEELKTGMVFSKDLGENTKHVVLVIPVPTNPLEQWFGAFPQAEALTVHVYRLCPGKVPKTVPELMTFRRGEEVEVDDVDVPENVVSELWDMSVSSVGDMLGKMKERLAEDSLHHLAVHLACEYHKKTLDDVDMNELAVWERIALMARGFPGIAGRN